MNHPTPSIYRCPHCKSPCVQRNDEATGDWDATYECGTWRDDNGDEVRGEKCKRGARDQ